MISISIFYFDGHRLVDSNVVTEGDLLDAIDTAHRDRADLRAEIWTDLGRAGELGDRFVSEQTHSGSAPA